MIAKIYVAGPYSQGNVTENVRLAYKAANELADLGYAPFVPHATHFWDLLFPRPYSFWLELDNTFLPHCDGLLRLPGPSDGADAEVLLARAQGIPVFETVFDLRAHFEKVAAR